MEISLSQQAFVGSTIGNIHVELSRKGYFECHTKEGEFLAICKELGTPLPSRKQSGIVDFLTPRKSEDANPNSLSHVYGSDAFPFHTDGAYFRKPPKIIALRYFSGLETGTGTVVLPLFFLFDNSELRALAREMWSVRGRDINFYSSIWNDIDESGYFRYDLGCMSPVGCVQIQGLIEKYASSEITVNWEPDKTLFINNWLALHRRPKVDEKEINHRTLQRIMIDE